MKDAKSQDVKHVTVTTGDDTTLIDTPIFLNLRLIPKVFTAPLQAVGLVTSIFARMLNTQITVQLNDDKE